MKTILHISDLHFNHVDHDVLNKLSGKIVEINPDVLAVSGDVTQRARVSQFKAFRAFIDLFSMPKIMVPGNHDIPLYNIVRRFVGPLRRFRKLVEPNLFPVFECDEFFAFGINTARRWKAVEGVLGSSQIRMIHQRLNSVSDQQIKVMVCHHPVSNLGRSKRRLNGTSVDVILSGHLHMSESKISTIDSGSVLLIQAGTAASTRRRDELNSFNLISVGVQKISIDVYIWNVQAENFQPHTKRVFSLIQDVWQENSSL